jgi:hypothetical protein
VEGESSDNFNWGVRRRPLSEIGTEPETEGEADETIMSKSVSRSNSQSTNELLTNGKSKTNRPHDIDVQIMEPFSGMTNPEESSDEEELGLSPLEDISPQLNDSEPPTLQPVSLNNADSNELSASPVRSRRLSDTSIDSSSEDDTTPCNNSPLEPLAQVGEEPEEAAITEADSEPQQQQQPQTIKLPLNTFTELQFDPEDGDLV